MYPFSARGLLNRGMGANLSTILPMIHFLVVVLACILTCIAAQPYPGDEAGRKSETFGRLSDDHIREPIVAGMMVTIGGLIDSRFRRDCSASKRQHQSGSCQQSVAQWA
jgi:hypothetical protein